MEKKDATFDWFQLDRDSLFGILYDTREKVVNQKLTPDQIHRKFVNQIRQYIPVKFKKIYDPKVEPGKVWIGGAYYSDYDADCKKCIEINFNYHNKTRAVKLSSRMFSRICLTFADTVLHEIIHMRQHRRRNWKVLPDFPSTASRTKQREEQKYLGCRDEVDAYAFNAACELTDMFSNKKTKIVNYINQDHKGRNVKNCYLTYLKAFGHDHNHPVVKNLKKKIVSYLPQSEVGKPYKNSDWINH
jgi:hypothetical protein